MHTPPPDDNTSRAQVVALDDGASVKEEAAVAVSKPRAADFAQEATRSKIVADSGQRNTKDDKGPPAEITPLPGEPVPLAEVAPLPVTKPRAADQTETKDDKKPEAEAQPAPPNPPEPPKPHEETPEERAARLLKEHERVAGVELQEKLQRAEAAYQTGLKLFNDLQYEEAKQYFEQAVALNPAHTGAQQKLRTVNGLLNVHADNMARQIQDLEREQRVRMQEQMQALQQALEDGRELEERGSQTPTEVDPKRYSQALADQLDYLKQAQERYRRVREIINWMPPSLDLPALRTQVDGSLTRVRSKIDAKDDEINFRRRQEAKDLAEQARVKDSAAFKLRICKLLEQVKDLYDRHDYKAAERLSISILVMDPFNSDAESWKNKARSAYHADTDSTTRTKYNHEYKEFMADVDQASISYDPLVLYPPNWSQITRRSELSLGKKGGEEAWKADIRKKLQRKVTFEFVDTPLDEAIGFLRQLSGVTMIVDPKILAAGGPQAITLRVTEMNLDVALEWILRLAELEYALKDNAIFISKGAELIDSAELRIYDVSDLTTSVQDFPGPDLALDVGKGAAGGGGAGGQIIAPPTNAPTLTSIADMIRSRVAPDKWDPALGTSIEERGGRLVVMQRPDVHLLIDQMLSSFRATQKMMINIESRFLTIREAYLEDIGVEFQGLDTNVLFGDYGDIKRLGFVQPRQPAAATNAPFPGFVQGLDKVNGGTFSTVGAITNHNIQFSGDPDSISTDANVLQGGLSGQLTILNNTQIQAFYKALAVRENESTLLAPRLTVFNTQRAHMFIARQQSYVADYQISGDSYEPVVRQFLVGVVLDVKPIVSSDRRYVTLELRPTVTELIAFTTRQIDSFTVNTGANVNVIINLSFPIQFPDLAIRRVRTTATVPDGGILLIGGLYRNIQFNAENGVPFLSDLPVIGRLFRWNVVDKAKSNLAILVSPKIILFEEEENKL